MSSRSKVAVAHILVIDDEALIRDTLAEFLTQEGFVVESCASGEQALARAAEQQFDVAICDVQLPGINGLELLNRLLKLSPQTFVLLITAYATVENAVQAFQSGAHDYLMKPIILDEVLGKLRRMMRFRELFQENQDLRRELNRDYDPDHIIGRGSAMQHVFEMVRKVAPTRSTVLLTGESGTGKELVARAIHRQSGAGDARFVAVNCAAIPNDLLENQLFGHRRGAFTGAERDQPGVFLHAGAGTVFLDEIAELTPATQAKLLRAIEQKEILPVGASEPVRVEARVLAATNKDLRKEVAAGKFREDLFYRLNVVAIELPPLRDRREDIPDLVEFLVAKQARELGKRLSGVDHDTMQLLISCPWPGNVRELENALQRAAILGDGPLIARRDLPPDLAPLENDPYAVDDLGEAVKRFEKQHIERILRQTPDKRDAAERLKVGLSSLYRRIGELGIEKEV
jgi:DNA-binding NtrC family response regulator